MNCMDCKNRYKYVSASDCKEFLCNNFELIEGTPKPETLYKINEDSLSPLVVYCSVSILISYDTIRTSICS